MTGKTWPWAEVVRCWVFYSKLLLSLPVDLQHMHLVLNYNHLQIQGTQCKTAAVIQEPKEIQK